MNGHSILDPTKRHNRNKLNAILKCGQLKLRAAQRPPLHDDWLTWLLLGGRGSGKTHAGAVWVQGLALGLKPFAKRPTSPIALIGETLSDVREVMIEGPAGICAQAGFSRPRYEPTRRRLLWPNGMIAEAYSAHDPERLRGPQFAAAWCDELCKWPYAQECWDMLQFGMRIGDWPRQLVTTTPKPIAILKHLMSDQKTHIAHMKTSENVDNLAPSFLTHMNDRYGGTALGRQELLGELIEARQGALWSRQELEQRRLKSAPDLIRILVAIDPPATAKATSDACGIVVAGCDQAGHAYILADRTIQTATPTMWAGRAIGEYHAWDANALIAEVNQGGDMVKTVIAAVDGGVPVIEVRANRGKYLRAEPVAALYAQGRVHHVGALPELEDEMCDFTVSGLSSNKSPDRLDACVWAINQLLLQPHMTPRVRTLK